MSDLGVLAPEPLFVKSTTGDPQDARRARIPASTTAPRRRRNGFTPRSSSSALQTVRAPVETICQSGTGVAADVERVVHHRGDEKDDQGRVWRLRNGDLACLPIAKEP